MAKFRYQLIGGNDPVIGDVPVKQVRRFFGWHVIGSPLNALNKKRNKAMKDWNALVKLMGEITEEESQLSRLSQDLRNRGHGASDPWVDPKQLAWFVTTEPEEAHPGTTWKSFLDYWRRTIGVGTRRGAFSRYSPRPDVARETARMVEVKDGHVTGLPDNIVGYRDPTKEGRHQQQQQQQGKRKGGNNQGNQGNKPNDPHQLPDF